MTITELTTQLAGESRLLRLPAGTCLHLESGHLTLTEMPGWLDSAVYTPGRALNAGAVYVAPHSVWVRLDAASTSQLAWRWPAPAALPAPRAAWRALVKGWRALAAPKRTATPLSR